MAAQVKGSPEKKQDPKDNRIVNEDKRITNQEKPDESPHSGNEKTENIDKEPRPEIEIPKPEPTTTEEERPKMGN